MISPMRGASTSIARTVLPSSFGAHVEGFDLLRVVGDDDRLLERLLGQIALVLALQIGAPVDGELPVALPAFSRMLDRLGVGDVLEVRRSPRARASTSTVLSMRLLKNSRSGRQLSSTYCDDVLQELLGERHVAVEVAEGHLRLDHPELGEVARRVRVLGAERRAEGVDVAEREREDLALELPAHGEVGGLAEEVLREVDGAVLLCAAGSPGRAW